MKLTNSIGQGAGYTCLFTFSTPIEGTYSFEGQTVYEWVIGQAKYNVLVFGVSLSIKSYDSECYYRRFERNPRMDTRGTDTLLTRRVLYVTPTTPVYFLINYLGGTGNFKTASNNLIFLRYTPIA